MLVGSLPAPTPTKVTSEEDDDAALESKYVAVEEARRMSRRISKASEDPVVIPTPPAPTPTPARTPAKAPPVDPKDKAVTGEVGFSDSTPSTDSPTKQSPTSPSRSQPTQGMAGLPPEQRLQVAASSPSKRFVAPAPFSGYITKRGQRFPWSWKRRFFVLKNSQLTYYLKEDGAGSGVGRRKLGEPLNLEGYRVTSPQAGKLQISCELPEARELFLDFSSEPHGTLSAWADALGAHIEAVKQLRVERNNNMSLAAKDLPQRHCGYMRKKGQVFPRTWKRRFFVLEAGELTYFLNESMPGSAIGAEQVGTPLSLGGYQSTVASKERIVLTPPDAGRELELVLDNVGEIDGWVAAFTAHAAYLRTSTGASPRASKMRSKSLRVSQQVTWSEKSPLHNSS